MLRTDFAKTVCTSVVLSLLPVGNAAEKLPDHPVRPAGESKAAEGIAIASLALISLAGRLVAMKLITKSKVVSV